MRSDTMRAAVIDAIRAEPRVQDIAMPKIGPDDALVRVVASGICRSDWHLWNGDWEWFGDALPQRAVLGHEIGGVIEAVGENVRSFRPGMRVTIPFNLACGSCPYCRRGRQNLCDNLRAPMLVEGSGGWAQYMCAPNADVNCVALPDGVDELAAAALGCRYMTAWRAVQSQGAVRGGETVAIFGCGGVGQAAVEIATVLGARVIAVDIDDKKLEQVRQLGAETTANIRGMDADQAARHVRSLTDSGVGADLSIDALGSQTTMLGALQSLRKGGRLCQVGLTSQAERGIIPVPTDLLVQREWEIRGSLGNPHGGYHDLLGLVTRGKLNPTRLVSREVSLSDVGSVLHDMDHYRTQGYVIITRFD